MKIHFATDHAGFEMKEVLIDYVCNELGYSVIDEGAYQYNEVDDYPNFIHKAAHAVSVDPENTRAIILGGSGQGEAMVANKYKGVRAAVYYGTPATTQTDASGNNIGMIISTREHNDANVLSLGARFLTIDESERVVKEWLAQEFGGEERHQRRIHKIDTILL